MHSAWYGATQLNDRLKKQYGQGCLEQFPGKGFMYMKPEHAHDRRYRLQRWLQKIGGQKLIVEGETFQNFLLNSQKVRPVCLQPVAMATIC